MEHSKVIQELKEAGKEMKTWQFVLLWIWLVLTSPMPLFTTVAMMMTVLIWKLM